MESGVDLDDLLSLSDMEDYTCLQSDSEALGDDVMLGAVGEENICLESDKDVLGDIEMDNYIGNDSGYLEGLDLSGADDSIPSNKSTRHMPSFKLDTPEMADFVKYLGTVDGGNKSSSTSLLIAKDISKYLHFSDSTQIDWGVLLDKQMLHRYFEYLKTNCCIGPEGRLTKLERTCDAIRYIKMDLVDDEKLPLIESITDQIGRWKSALRKEKKKLNHIRLKSLSDSSKLDFDLVKKFVSNPTMWERFDKIIGQIRDSKNSVSPKELKFSMSAVMVTTLFKGWQRPGAVKNLKLKEFERSTLVDDIHIVSVCEYKTGVGGAARLMLEPELHSRIQKYVAYVRPNCIDPENVVDNVFILPEGRQVGKLGNIIRFMEAELNISIPSATDVRKIGASAVARKCSEGETRIVAKQMSHDPRVAAKFYHAVRGAKDAKQAYDMMTRVFEEEAAGSSTTNEEEDGPSRKPWDDDALKKTFEYEISHLKTPKLSACFGLVPGKTSKQIQDKIRTYIRQEKRKKRNK